MISGFDFTDESKTKEEIMDEVTRHLNFMRGECFSNPTEIRISDEIERVWMTKRVIDDLLKFDVVKSIQTDRREYHLDKDNKTSKKES